MIGTDRKGVSKVWGVVQWLVDETKGRLTLVAAPTRQMKTVAHTWLFVGSEARSTGQKQWSS